MIGQVFRLVLGNRFYGVARVYRRCFVDLDTVAALIPPLKSDDYVMDLGGGDGELLRRILLRYPQVNASLVDKSKDIGGALPSGHNVALHPETDLQAYIAKRCAIPNIVVLSDVLHHIPPLERTLFLTNLRDLIAAQDFTVFVKDVEPGSCLSRLGYLSDRFVTGDKHVSFITQHDLINLIKSVFSNVNIKETKLMVQSPPNYCLIVERS